MANRYWTDDEGRRWLGGSIVLGDRRVFNPTDEQLAAAGYEAHEPAPYVRTLADIKAGKLAEIEAYDMSDAVNSFDLDGVRVWLDKATRVGLVNSLNCEAAAGREETTLWLGTWPITINVVRAQELLQALELYALGCYNTTAQHKLAVEQLETVEEVEAYDYMNGYPERLTITTREEAGDE